MLRAVTEFTTWGSREMHYRRPGMEKQTIAECIGGHP
jgi:hypothetical protein